MIVDSSAILAVLYREPDAGRYVTVIASATACRMSVANVLEASIVPEARGGATAGHELDTFLQDAAIELMPVTAEHLDAARCAWDRASGHSPAACRALIPRGRSETPEHLVRVLLEHAGCFLVRRTKEPALH